MQIYFIRIMLLLLSSIAIALLTIKSAFATLPSKPNPTVLESVYKFDLITPTGEKIFRSAIQWESEQIDNPNYPRPAKCAVNISRVLQMSGLGQYKGESVGALLESIVNNGGRLIKLPRDKAGIIAKLNSIYSGNLPVGTVIGGCIQPNCFSGEKGQRHSAIVADSDERGNIFIYHNNWYRPENEGGQWMPNMVSKLFLGKGYIRQWMETPWIRLIKDDRGKIIDFKSLMPKIDDLDPYQYYISIAIPKEIHEEIGDRGYPL